jgi:hypothetical protein
MGWNYLFSFLYCTAVQIKRTRGIRMVGEGIAVRIETVKGLVLSTVDLHIALL